MSDRPTRPPSNLLLAQETLRPIAATNRSATTRVWASIGLAIVDYVSHLIEEGAPLPTTSTTTTTPPPLPTTTTTTTPRPSTTLPPPPISTTTTPAPGKPPKDKD